MSRLAALKEYTFMRALRENGMRVPEPFACNRHTIVMELIDAFPLRQIKEVPDPARLYAELIEMILKLAEFGLIHGDFNEFNILIKEEEIITNEKKGSQTAEAEEPPKPGLGTYKLIPYLIDFPQMVSVDHANAKMYFDRDVDCIKKFFERRFHFTSDEPGPHYVDAKKRAQMASARRLDVEAEASGYSKKMAKELEKYMEEVGVADDHGGGFVDEEDSSSSSEGSSTDNGNESAGGGSSNVKQTIDKFGNNFAVVQEAPDMNNDDRECFEPPGSAITQKIEL